MTFETTEAYEEDTHLVELNRRFKKEAIERMKHVEPVPLSPIAGIIVGQLVGLTHDGCIPLVIYPDQPGTTAIEARSVVDIQGPHIGGSVILMFEGGNPLHPIIMGIIRDVKHWPLPCQAGQVELDVDGERLIITAKEQIVLRCGKASITLTRAGKVLIDGTYVLSRSSGANRIKGGSVQLN